MCDFEREGQYPLESQAPLADIQLPKAQGLTLEDLEQWHTGVEPDLKPEELLGDDLSLSPTPSTGRRVRVLKKEDPIQSVPETTPAELNALLSWSVDTHRYALSKREDVKRLSKQSDLLFQRIPQYLDRLTQVLHAHDQCQLLYERMAELSEKRGSAALIIQTARQVEVLEKNLKEKRFRAEELKKMQTDLSAHLALTERYQAIFQQIPHLNILNLD